MNFERAASELMETVSGKEVFRAGQPVKLDGLEGLVAKYVPAGTEDRSAAERALGRIEGVAAMLTGLKDRSSGG
jgi:argininosuccinate synthase